MPLGVVIPDGDEDGSCGSSLLNTECLFCPEEADLKQNGQTVGEALVLDTTRHLNQLLTFDLKGRTACVQPGMVLEHLNRFLKPYGLFYPVDVSTANRATIGGMTGNNSCGSLDSLWQYGAQRAQRRGSAC